MNRSALSRRDRRALSIGATAVVIAAGTRLLLFPYVTKEEALHDQIVQEERALLHDQLVLRSAREQPEQFTRAEEDLFRMLPRLVNGGTETSIQAALVEDVQAAAQSGGVRLDRLEPLKSEVVGDGVRAHSIRVDGEGDLEGILTLLSALDASPVLMRIANLSISGGAAPAYASPSGAEKLRFRCTITGYELTTESIPTVAGEEAHRSPPAADSHSHPAIRAGVL